MIRCPHGCQNDSYNACDRNGTRTECTAVCCPAFLEREAGQADLRGAPQASAAQIATARAIYCGGTSDDIAIDDDALLSDCGDGAYWVQAWVYVDADEPGPSCSECYAVLDELGVWEGRELICRTCAELITEAGNGDLAAPS